jgi:cell division protein FtsN
MAGVVLLIGMLVGVLSIALYQKVLDTLSLKHAASLNETKINADHLAQNTQQSEHIASTGHTPNTKGKGKRVLKKHFTFYQLLPGMEIPISEPSETTVAANAPVSPAEPVPFMYVTTPKKVTPVPSSATATTPVKPRTALGSAKQPVTQPLKTTPAQYPKVLRKLAAAQYLLQVDAFKNPTIASALKTRLTLQGFTPNVYKVEAEDGVWFRVILGPYPSEMMALRQKSRLEKQKIHAILILQRQ